MQKISFLFLFIYVLIQFAVKAPDFVDVAVVVSVRLEFILNGSYLMNKIISFDHRYV